MLPPTPPPPPAHPLLQVAIPGTLSLAWRLGHALQQARRSRQDPAAAAVAAYGSGQVLFRGKVRWLPVGLCSLCVAGRFAAAAIGLHQQPLLPGTTVRLTAVCAGTTTTTLAGLALQVVEMQRETRSGFATGRLRLAGLAGSCSAGRQLQVAFQNELLAAWEQECEGEEGGGGGGSGLRLVAATPDLLTCVDLEGEAGAAAGGGV